MSNDIKKPAEYTVTSQQTELVIEYLKQLDPSTHKTYYYDASIFYNDKKVKPAIKTLLAANKPAKDYNEILTKLQAKPAALLQYYKTIMSDGQLQLKKDVYNVPSIKHTQELAAKYTKASGTRKRPVYTSLRQLLSDKLQGDELTETVTDYAITDNKALEAELKKSKKLTVTLYELIKSDSDTPALMSDTRQEADKLASKIGLDDSEYKKAHGIFWNFTFNRALADILGVMLDGSPGKSKTHYTPPNIREGTNVNTVPKPPIEAINETLMKLAEDPATEETINKLYIDEQDRIRKNGLPVRIDSLEQQALFDSLTDRGIKPIKKILDITTSLTIPAFYMLSGHLQKLQRDSDRQIEDLVIPEMSITEFMRINPRFNTAKALKKGIKAEHKEATINSLDLLRLVQYPINRPIKKNGKTVGYELSSVKVYDYSLVADKNKKIQSIKNLKYSQDFLDKYNRILAIPYGDGFYLLTEMTHQQLDIYIQGLMTNKENIKRTVANEPLIINAKEFKKIYKKYNPFDFYRTLTNGLNKLADDEIKEIDRWHTKAGGQTITSQNPDSQILYIYPTTIHKALITTEERKTIKQEQARRLRDLKSLVTKYRKDLKTNKTSSLEYLNYLAEDLEISTDELQTILAGNQPISDELMHKINELYNDFKD